MPRRANAFRAPSVAHSPAAADAIRSNTVRRILERSNLLSPNMSEPTCESVVSPGSSFPTRFTVHSRRRRNSRAALFPRPTKRTMILSAVSASTMSLGAMFLARRNISSEPQSVRTAGAKNSRNDAHAAGVRLSHGMANTAFLPSCRLANLRMCPSSAITTHSSDVAGTEISGGRGPSLSVRRANLRARLFKRRSDAISAARFTVRLL